MGEGSFNRIDRIGARPRINKWTKDKKDKPIDERSHARKKNNPKHSKNLKTSFRNGWKK